MESVAHTICVMPVYLNNPVATTISIPTVVKKILMNALLGLVSALQD